MEWSAGSSYAERVLAESPEDGPRHAFGDFESALALLDRSLQTPSGVTIQELRLDPVWDALRRDPRFQHMLAKFGGKP